jgi:predicted ester cyclase
MEPGELIERAWNRGDLSAIDEAVHADYVRHTAFGDLVGPDAWKTRINETRAAFPDFRVEVHDVLVDGDRSAVRFSVSGTHQGAPYMGFEPTGTVMTFDGIVIARRIDGKLVEEWEMIDTAAALRALTPSP